MAGSFTVSRHVCQLGDFVGGAFLGCVLFGFVCCFLLLGSFG